MGLIAASFLLASPALAGRIDQPFPPASQVAKGIQKVVFLHLVHDAGRSEGTFDFAFKMLTQKSKDAISQVKRLDAKKDAEQLRMESHNGNAVYKSLYPTLLKTLPKGKGKGSAEGKITFIMDQAMVQAGYYYNFYDDASANYGSSVGWSYRLSKVDGQWKIIGRTQNVAAG
jgi:hypothetical protein